MTEPSSVLDVSDAPELLRLAEEVSSTNSPRTLKRGDEVLARVVPMKRRQKQGALLEADKAAFLASAGGWEGLVDVDKLITDIYESRRASSRPPVDL